MKRTLQGRDLLVVASLARKDCHSWRIRETLRLSSPYSSHQPESSVGQDRAQLSTGSEHRSFVFPLPAPQYMFDHPDVVWWDVRDDCKVIQMELWRMMSGCPSRIGAVDSPRSLYPLLSGTKITSFWLCLIDWVTCCLPTFHSHCCDQFLHYEYRDRIMMYHVNSPSSAMALPVRWRQYLQIEHRHWPMARAPVGPQFCP